MDNLAEERANPGFDVNDMSLVLYGKLAPKVRYLAQLVSEDPVFAREVYDDCTRAQSIKKAWQKAAHLFGLKQKLNLSDEEFSLFKIFVDEINFSDLHWYMFVPAIKGGASDEQVAAWLPKAMRMEWIGCYAQTELGHGSNVQGLETTATYNRDTEEFELHSPTLTSTKWWPGGLGKAATHAIVYARLITKRKDYGVHAFLVQLRSLSDHHPLPGISVGDIGPKFGNGGYNNMDNGYLRFSHVRIPRSQLLARYSQVQPDGTYVQATKAARQLAYGTMVSVRRGLVFEAMIALARAVVVAVRYSCVRRQFATAPGRPENKVMDYQMQQLRLLPLLATAYAFNSAGAWMYEFYARLQERIAQGDLSMLPEAHASTAGLKALSTSVMAAGIEECRMLCGGHGYSLYSGLPQLYAQAVPAATYEGDNVVLYLQVARYLLKCLSSASQGNMPTGTAAYMADAAAVEDACSATAPDHFTIPLLLQCLQVRAFRKAATAAAAVAAAESLEAGFLGNSVALIEAAQAHAQVIVAARFSESVKAQQGRAERRGGAAAATAAVLKQLCQLYCLSQVDKAAGDMQACGFFTAEHPPLVRQQLLALLPQVRAKAVPLVDAFQFSDHFLNSSLGRFDGRAYESLYERALGNPLNRTDVADGYEEYLRPLLTSAQNSRL